MLGDDAVDFRFIAENSIDIIWSNGLDHVIHYVSLSVFHLLGWKPEEMIGKVFDDFVLPEDLPILAAAATLMFSPGVQNSPSTLRMRRKDGSSVWMETNARLVREPATGEPKEFVLVMRDITERKKLEGQVSASAVDFQFLAKYSADVICRAGVDLAIEYLSPSSLELLGWKPEERIGQKAYELIIPADRPVFMKAYQRLLEGAESVCASVRMRKKNGSIVWMEGNARLMRDSATEAPKGAVVIMRDITKRKKLEDQLAASTVDFKFLEKYSADLICRTGKDQVIEYLSPSSLELLGWTPEERIGNKVSGLVIPEDLTVFEKAYQRLLAGAETVTAEVRIRKKNGSIVWMEGNARLGRNPETQEIEGIVLITRDITKRKKLETQLSALALTDGLTGLLNRRAFDEALEREWKRTLREGSEMSLLLLDIDHFKQFNDQYGHQAGDDCLRAVAAAVSEAVRITDTVARYGGEEITVILPSTFTAGAVEVAEKIRASVEALQLPLEGNPEGGSWVSVSVGVATALARQGGTMRMPESLLLAADNAMYKAKHEGRNRVATALLIASKES
jgi:diguanylate cyclase (GGDEF)-like protein/PAS domain S-box-containing protein